VRTSIVIAWVVLALLVIMTRGMRWTAVLTYLSAVSLLVSIIQVTGVPSDRGWFLLAWAVLVLPVAIGLFSHPMRGPAWGLFVGFWGVVGALWLIVVQILAVAGLLGGAAYRGWAAWPLALIGFWFLVASSLGFGEEKFPRWVDVLGILAGAGLLVISVTTWVGASEDVIRGAGLFAAAVYCYWALGLGSIYWRTQHVTHRFRGLSPGRAV
jgi:hypothetical protein